MGWLIDPDEQTVFVFQLSQEPEVFDDAIAELLLPEFMGEFSLTAGELFSCLV
jgi:Uma2 family endonuclease